VKKFTRGVPKLLSDDQKNKLVRVLRDFIDAASLCSKAMLDSIITMNKIMVSLPHICDKEEVQR
jgi:hypothetical protein